MEHTKEVAIKADDVIAEIVKRLIEQFERGEITREDLLDLMDPHTVNITE